MNESNFKIGNSLIFSPKCFHLCDRVGKPRFEHVERYSVPQIPTLVELCTKAGLDLEKYPKRRRNLCTVLKDGLQISN